MLSDLGFSYTLGVKGSHNFLGNSANTDLIHQAKGDLWGKSRYPLLPLKQTTNKQTNNAPSVLSSSHF